MSLESVMANVVLLLLFSSALPLQSNLLGLTTVTLPSALKIKETISQETAAPLSEPLSVHESESIETGASWWIWPFGSASESSPISMDEHVASQCAKHCPVDSQKFQAVSLVSPANSRPSADPKPLFSQLLQIFVPISILPAANSFTEEPKGASPPSSFSHLSSSPPSSSSISSNSVLRGRLNGVMERKPTIAVQEDRSLWTQFISRAFGISSPTTPASCSLIIVILMYNLCFLATSVWIAGRRLSGPTLSFSLELVTSFRCVQQLQWTGRGDNTRVVVRKDSHSQGINLGLSPSASSLPRSCAVIAKEQSNPSNVLI
ncbi:hypothetical protein FBUS_06099 [Fasciolopsis buskii]|uniref:Uncharacterized protein n=1 Tax=Fasciolopsis buskii TaxID=27845 RepID=A0A8E0RKQ5_9TREM|nr:hypothetical protein FBUS_06099 [Fasciolopsis buski]